jgi:hypothetical protein
MKKYLLIPVLVLLALTQANSQVRCGFDGVLNAELEKDPKYSINIEEVNAKIERQIMRQKTFNSVDDIVYIPVVFHILHRGGAVGAYDNPTDASVISTVDYLNEVYDGTWNGTGGSILGVGDINIKFVLATKDPDNNTTTGIERIDASSIGDYSSSGLKLRGTSGVDEATLKNLSRWDPFKYYNIWVVHEIDGCGGSPNNCSSWTGGFAYFPFEPVGVSTLSGAGTRDRDGTVMLATGMSPGNALLPHEIGHALNLYHPFQGTDNTGACPPADPTEGDRCADTDPITNPQGAWNTYSGYARDGSPYPLSNPNSCADGKPYNELTEKNFMNYTFTTRLFTADQKNRMKASVMSTIREGLSTSWANNKGAYPTTWVAPKAAVVTPVTSETGMGGIYAGIYRVELNDMIVNSLVTNQEGGYLNNADKWYNLFSIKAGSTYTMKVNIFNGSNNNQLGVYIDYDNDGAFNETTEKIFLDTNIPTSDGTGNTSEKSITFTVPASASMSTGSIVRMRVINDLSSIYGLAPVSGSSSSLSYGQAEDYAIYLGADNAVTLSSAAGTDSQTACINMAIINITYATTGATGATFSGLPTGVSGNWSANVVTISGTPSVVGASQPYTITLTGGSGAVTTTGTLTVVSTISPSFTQVGPVCSGASLSALPTTSTNGITGTWSPVINNTATTNYTFTPSEEGQCTTTASMTITVNTLPTAAITNNTATTVLTCSTAAISVTATGGVSYAWNNSLGTNATASITAAGTYTVTVTNANGCTDTQSITITENLSYIYVNKAATGNNNGTSWTDAFTDLQDAIDVNCSNVEIWVAAGTYYPTASPDGTTTDPRNKAFHLGMDMKIYGGFAGGETELSARNPADNVTILSGDFDNDDTVTGGGSTLTFSDNAENAYHIIITADLTAAAVIDGFTIKGGNADGSGSITYQSETFYQSDGGGMDNYSSSPTITNSTFTNNFANVDGGGMYNRSSSPTITNSTFANNSAADDGGGMANINSSPNITNSTFANNNATTDGGGMSNDSSSSPIITNTIIWDNGSSEVANNSSSSTPIFKNSIIKSSGGSGSWNTAYGTDNGANLDTDPLFVDAANGDYSLQGCSPAINTGDNTAWTTTTLSTDIAGNTRPYNSGIVDMGAYEYQGIPYTTAIYVNKAATGSNDGSSWTDAYTDLQDAIDNQCGGFDIWVAAGTYYPTKDHTGNTSPTDNRDKNFHLGTDMKIYGGFAGTETQLSARDAAANITRLSGDIDNASGGAGNAGNAYHVIITADLTVAAVIDGFTIEGGNANGSGTISYQSISFYRDYGGGMGNYSSSPTITNSTFTNNNSAFDGGGMLNYSSSSPTITNSTFADNNAGYYGGGMANLLSSPTITNSTFTNNNSAGDGGGMSNSSSSPTITNSTFTNNFANVDGGGMYNYGSSPNITNSTFTNNGAGDGGGMANNSSSPTITNSTFADNNAGYYGGGMANLLSSPTITNSTFANNYADLGGGGMYNYYLSSPTITNSTFTNNNSDYGGGGMYNTDSSSPTITNSTFANNYADLGGGGMVNINGCSPMITNSIIWNNGSSEVLNNNGTPIFKNSIIKDSGGSGSWNTAYGTDNGDNLDTDPLFVNAVSGDYTLQGCSPAIDTGDNAAWTTTTLITDIAGNTRPFNSTVDIGAYEYQGIPIAISIAAPTVTQPTCAVPSGTIVVNATTTSGTLEYSIDNGSTYQASATFSGLSGGSYTIKAREQGSSCTETYGSNPVVINTPVILTIAAPTVTQPTCAVPSGTIVVNATTTSGTLEYSVDNGSTYQTESTFSGLSAGSYTITVREQGSSCTETYGSNPVVINTPVILTIAAPTVTQPTCAVPSGTIVVNATTTSGTLEYSVDNGSTYQASNTFGGLSGGSYTIKIRVEGSVCEGTYGSNPVAIDTLLLTYELTPSISVSQTELCVGESITLSATNIPNSVDGATIHWTGGFTGESITVSPSTSGDFRVAVRSANGCLSDSSDAVSITVNQLPSNPVITSDNASLCTGETVTLSGSCETNTVFSWITPVENTNGATTSALSNSNQRVINAAGTYTGYCETTTGCRSGEVSIVITESTNCGSEQVIAISPAKPTICPGEVISLTASGCTGTLTWSGGLASQIGSTASFNPVIATTYSVTCSTGGSGTVDVSVVKANEVISSNISTGTSQVRALETIQSDKKIGDTNVTPAPNVIFQSGKSILLSPGFEVTTESVFKAIIQITCPDSD